MSGALTVGDLAYARTRRFQSRLDRARAAVERAADLGRLGISYSGGKDSTCTLHLVRQVQPDAPAALFDSGAEYADTYAMAAHVGAEIVAPAWSFPAMCRRGGYWGYRGPEVTGERFDFTAVLITEPSDRFVLLQGVRVLALGLRGSESHARKMLGMSRGELFDIKRRRTYADHPGGEDPLSHVLPLTWWDDDDVWAYIASRELRYHSAYDRMAALGLPRRDWRVSTLIDATAAGLGRFSTLRRIEPDAYARFVGDFPDIARYT